MPANVETMFSVRETPWHGLGRIVMDAPASREALELAGLDWQVESRNIYSGNSAVIPGYRANVRSTDNAVLGVVSDRYRIVQNEEAFQFTDDLLGEGVTYETAGSLQGGKKVWIINCFLGFLIGRFDQRQHISYLCPSNSLCRMEKSLQAAINPVSTFGMVFV